MMMPLEHAGHDALQVAAYIQQEEPRRFAIPIAEHERKHQRGHHAEDLLRPQVVKNG